MNILITSIGQRGYLIDHFKESARGQIGVYAADATKYAPGLQKADKAFVLPYAGDPAYFLRLLQICKENDISGVISINDLELSVLARHKRDLAQHGIMAVVSDPEVVDICFDKYKTFEFCTKNGIRVPRTYLWTDVKQIEEDVGSGKLSFPIVAKPRKGSRSIGVHLVHDLTQLLVEIDRMNSQAIPEDERFIFQEYIDSEQYSVHVFNDASLRPVAVVGMVNIFRHLGETFHIKTFRDRALIELGIAIGEKLKHLGPLSADVHQRGNGEYVVLEFNPRISGCYSLSHYAGADFPGKICRLLRNEPIEFDAADSFEDGVIMLKQFTTMKVSESMIAAKVQQ